MGCRASKDSDSKDSNRGDDRDKASATPDGKGRAEAERRLLQASADGNAAECEKAILGGASVHAADWGGITALHLAAGSGHVATVATLLGLNAELSWVDDCGGTALHSAASNGHLLMVESLISAQADVEARNDDGKTAIDLARADSHDKVVAAMLVADTLATRMMKTAVREFVVPELEFLGSVPVDDTLEPRSDPSLHDAPSTATQARDNTLLRGSLSDRPFTARNRLAPGRPLTARNSLSARSHRSEPQGVESSRARTVQGARRRASLGDPSFSRSVYTPRPDLLPQDTVLNVEALFRSDADDEAQGSCGHSGSDSDHDLDSPAGKAAGDSVSHGEQGALGKPGAESVAAPVCI